MLSWADRNSQCSHTGDAGGRWLEMAGDTDVALAARQQVARVIHSASQAIHSASQAELTRQQQQVAIISAKHKLFKLKG